MTALARQCECQVFLKKKKNMNEKIARWHVWCFVNRFLALLSTLAPIHSVMNDATVLEQAFSESLHS